MAEPIAETAEDAILPHWLSKEQLEDIADMNV